jgi:transcriptional regulator GlxA family with amidase domain
MMVIDRVRPFDEPQRLPLQRHLHANQPKLAEVAQLMEANIEEPIGLDELAGYVGISRRQMERLFLTHLGCSPSRYYLKVRLERAQQLLKQTSCPIVEIAGMCGFVSAPHFSRCYRRYLGRAPMADRSPARAVVRLRWPDAEIEEEAPAALAAEDATVYSGG